MFTSDEPALVVDLSGPQWQALLSVAPPRQLQAKVTEFDVAPIGSQRPEQLRRVEAHVLFTTARNEGSTGWPEWHVKVYRCDVQGDVEALRWHLHRQANALQQVNRYLPGPERRTPIEPPWAVVPVQVARGDGTPEELAGSVSTRLGAPAEQIVTRLYQALPDWFGDPTQPNLFLLAVSPKIDPPPWEDYKRWPGTEHLADFRLLAAGLDQLHRLGWAHCDIKPDNVCQYTYGDSSGYVLIDTDAATPTVPPPLVLRGTVRYEYRRLREMRLGLAKRTQITAGLLYAQDRFGFALVVLSALAGRAWVDHTLLAQDEGHPSAPRIADREETVAAELRTYWPDPRWAPLIEVLAEPFGTGARGQIAIEAPDAWAADWLARVIEAERRCHGGNAPVAPAPDRRLPMQFAADLRRIREEAWSEPAPRLQRVRLAYDAIERRAKAVAVREALKRAAWLTAALTLAGVLVSLGAFVVGS